MTHTFSSSSSSSSSGGGGHALTPMNLPRNQKIREGDTELPHISSDNRRLTELLEAGDQRRHKSGPVGVEERGVLDKDVREVGHLEGMQAVFEQGPGGVGGGRRGGLNEVLDDRGGWVGGWVGGWAYRLV